MAECSRTHNVLVSNDARNLQGEVTAVMLGRECDEVSRHRRIDSDRGSHRPSIKTKMNQQNHADRIAPAQYLSCTAGCDFVSNCDNRDDDQSQTVACKSWGQQLAVVFCFVFLDVLYTQQPCWAVDINVELQVKCEHLSFSDAHCNVPRVP